MADGVWMTVGSARQGGGLPLGGLWAHLGLDELDQR